MNWIKTSGLFGLITFMITGCAIKNRLPEKTVPIEVIVQTDDPQLNTVNLDVYALKVIDRLEDFNVVNFDVAEEGDTAEVILKINIENFNSFPPDRRVSRRIFRRAIQVGTDNNGRPVYQTVSASADIVQTRIRTSAFFKTNLIIRGTPGKTFQRNFNSNLNIDNVYVTNIQGDSRALDPSVYSATFPPMEPLTDDVLLALSNRDMLDRLSREIRSYYDK